MKKIKLLMVVLMTLSCVASKAQNVTNIRVSQDGNYANIYYDLEKRSNIKIEASKDAGKTYFPIRRSTGDKGAVNPGKDKLIRWDYVGDMGYYNCDSLRVRITSYVYTSNSGSGHFGTSHSHRGTKHFNPSYSRMSTKHFITGNVIYSIAPQLSFGLTYGQVKHWGWFISAMASPSFEGFSPVIATCNEQGYVGNILPFYVDEKTSSRLSIMGGGMFRPVEPLALSLGLGYGIRNVLWQTTEGDWVKNEGYSTSGLDMSLGLQGFFGGFTISLDAVSTNFKTIEGKIGIGYAF